MLLSPLRSRNGCQPRGAFTLLELLIVISMLMVLVALLFPLAKNMRAAATSTQCANNLRQIGVLFHAEAADNNGVLNFQSYTTANTTKRWNNYLIEGGYLDSNNKISFCPSAAVVNGVPATGSGGYSYGGLGFVEEGDPYSGYVNGISTSRAVRLRTIDRPAQYWLLTDSWSSSNNHQLYMIDRSAASKWRMQLRHRAKANMLFADGHVMSVDLSTTKEFTFNPLTNAFDEKGQVVSK